MTEMKAKMMTLEAPEFPFSPDMAKVYSYTEKPSMKEVQKLKGDFYTWDHRENTT